MAALIVHCETLTKFDPRSHNCTIISVTVSTLHKNLCIKVKIELCITLGDDRFGSDV